MKQKQKIRINESQLRQIVKNSIKKIVNENADLDYNEYNGELGGTGEVRVSITSDDSAVEMYGNYDDCMSIIEAIKNDSLSLYVNDKLCN